MSTDRGIAVDMLMVIREAVGSAMPLPTDRMTASTTSRGKSAHKRRLKQR